MTKSNLQKLIKLSAPMLQPYLKFADAYGILMSIATLESSMGSYGVARFEKNFAPGGSYYNDELKERYKVWGALSACSFSDFQILYVTACELGFDEAPWKRSPMDLANEEVAIFYVIEFLKYRVIAKGGDTLEKLFDIYNSGKLDKNYPVQYIKDGVAAYNTHASTDYTST